MIINEVLNGLDEMIPKPVCELEYRYDYELLISTVLSARATDKGVNKVTKNLYKYNLNKLSELDIKEIEKIIKPLGNYVKKAYYVKTIAQRLINDCNGVVVNDYDYLITLPGVGRKTINVVLSNLYNIPTIAVDTHVNRVSKRLELVNENDNVLEIENKLMNFIPKDKWNRVNDQLVLFGRYICKSNPSCDKCKLNNKCKNKKNSL